MKKIKFSWDLDGGVLEGGHLYFFRNLNITSRIDKQEAKRSEMEFYASRKLKYRPALFASEGDEVFIITCRKTEARDITKKTLKKYEINAPIIFADEKGEIDWSSSYEEASKKAARLKAKVIKRLGINVHFDNNPIVVEALRELCPEVKIILISE